MRVATLKIRNKRNGKILIVNETDWASDLGQAKYSGWVRDGAETHGEEEPAAVVTTAPTEEVVEEESVEEAKETEGVEEDED